MVIERRNAERKGKKEGSRRNRGSCSFLFLESESYIGWDKAQEKFTIKQKQKFNFVLESKSCIGWDKPQAKFTINQKQKFTMKRK